MRLIKRLGTTFSGYMEQLVTTIEDPEQVLKAAIREIDRNIVKAELRLRKVKADGQQMEHTLSSLEKEVGLWVERAQREAPNDRERGVECLRRSKMAEKRRSQLAIEHQQHKETEAILREDIESVQLKRDELKSKLNLLSTREARSMAVKGCNSIFEACDSDLDDVLERWEFNIAIQEGSSTIKRASLDPLKEEYETKEEQRELEEELDRLTRQ